MWLSGIRRKSHIPSLYHIPSISPICVVQILGLKREIRIAFSRNGSLRPFKWNRNVIWNQCIRTCLDISTAPLHTLPPSLSLSLPAAPSSLCLPLVLPVSRSPPPSQPQRRGANRRGPSLKRARGADGGLAGHHENKVSKRHVGGGRKKGKESKIHCSSSGSHFHSLCAANV